MKKAALPPKDAAGAPTSPEETTPTKGKKKPLTDLACKKATCPPNRNRFRLYDTGGLYLEVLPTGRKGWYLKLRVRENNKLAEKRMSLGAYRSPDETPKPGKHSLQEARRLRDEQRLVHQSGKNPIEARRETKQVATATSVTFGDVAEEWQLSKSEQWSDSYKKKVQRLVGNFLLPRLGKRIMEKIAPNELDAAVQAILDNSPKKRRESANETLRIAQQIWNYALAKYATEDTFKRGNIATPLIKTGVLPAPEVTHNKAVTKPEHLAPILRAIRSYKGASPVVPTALQLVPILFVRSGNIQMMRWEEIDFDKAIWTIPRAKMKVKDRDFDFICPLPRQAVALLKALHRVTGHCEWVFPGGRSQLKPFSENALQFALKKALADAGIPHKQDIHGFRTVGRTLLAEKGYSAEVLETQLDHARRNTLGETYIRMQYLEDRTEMLQVWADMLDSIAEMGK